MYHDIFYCCRNESINVKYVLMHSVCNYVCTYSPEEVYSSLRRKGYNKVKSVLHLDEKVFAVDQHCYDVLIFPSHLKKDLANIDLFKDYKLIFQVNYCLLSL